MQVSLVVWKQYSPVHLANISGHAMHPESQKDIHQGGVDCGANHEQEMDEGVDYTEYSLHSRNCFKELEYVIVEYFTLKHTEPVPDCDLEKPCEEVYYLPIHAVVKSSSSTTKIHQ